MPLSTELSPKTMRRVFAGGALGWTTWRASWRVLGQFLGGLEGVNVR